MILIISASKLAAITTRNTLKAGRRDLALHAMVLVITMLVAVLNVKDASHPAQEKKDTSHEC